MSILWFRGGISWSEERAGIFFHLLFSSLEPCGPIGSSKTHVFVQRTREASHLDGPTNRGLTKA